MNSSEAYSETRLMTFIAQGDESAFEELYDLYKDLVFGLVTNIVGDKPTAEEIMETCHRFSSRKGFDKILAVEHRTPSGDR